MASINDNLTALARWMGDALQSTEEVVSAALLSVDGAVATAAASAVAASNAESASIASAAEAEDFAASINPSNFATAAQGAKADALSGRNLIINGTGRIHQRGYVSGTATVRANQYTLDRWRVVTSGQNLTYTGTVAGFTMTAPAGGVEQVIEGSNVVGGSYVLNWTGTATATVGGTARAKGETFTLTAGANATVRMIGGTFTDVQLEQGTVITPFERVDAGVEKTKCQRYYMRDLGDGMTGWPPLAGSTFTRRFFIQFPTSMRVSPTVSGQFAGHIGVLTVETTTPTSLRLIGTAGGDVECAMVGGLVLDAEL